LLGILCPELPKIIKFLQSKLMIPIFGILIFFAYIFSTLFIVASIVTADVCVYTSPQDNIDERIMNVLQTTPLKELLGPIVLEFIDFYIHQCPVDNLPQDIKEQLTYIEAGIPLIGQFSTIVTEKQSLTIIQDICGFQTNQTEALVDVVDTIQYQLCDIAGILDDIRNFMQCSNWYPLYEKTAYEALCYDGTRGFAYVATTQFIIVLCSFIILTFRVAFWDVQIGDIYYNFIDDENDTEKKEEKTNDDDDNNSNSEDVGYEVGYYKGIRDIVTASKKSQQVGQTAEDTSPSLLEGRMNILRQQQQQPTSLFDLRLTASSSLVDDGNATAITAAPTGSFQNDASFEEPLATATATADDRRNSRYPSRRRNNRNHRRDDNPLQQPQSQTRIATATSSANDGGNNEDGDGIEVEHYYSYNNNNNNNESSSLSTAGSGVATATDAWSVWAKQQKQNGNSGDDDDDDDDDGFNVNGLVDLDDEDSIGEI
jgi:hypothetical protein